MNFGDVIAGLKQGRRYERAGWNGKGMFIFLVPGSVFKVNREPLLSIIGEGTEVQYHAHIDMKTAQGYVVPWLASQPDMLAEDWQEVSLGVAAEVQLPFQDGSWGDVTLNPRGHGGADLRTTQPKDE